MFLHIIFRVCRRGREILEAHNKVAEKTKMYVPCNILPLDPDSSNQAIMRYPEIQASVSSLCNTMGLPWPKVYQKEVDGDSLDWLQAMFGFQCQSTIQETYLGYQGKCEGIPLKFCYVKHGRYPKARVEEVCQQHCAEQKSI